MFRLDRKRRSPDVVVPNERLVALHKKLGFTEIGVFDEYGKVDEDFNSAMWIQKRLAT